MSLCDLCALEPLLGDEAGRTLVGIADVGFLLKGTLLATTEFGRDVEGLADGSEVGDGVFS